MTNNPQPTLPASGQAAGVSQKEYDFAVKVANKVLDIFNEDPDSHRMILARQFLRSIETTDSLRAELARVQADVDELTSLLTKELDAKVALRSKLEAVRYFAHDIGGYLKTQIFAILDADKPFAEPAPFETQDKPAAGNTEVKE